MQTRLDKDARKAGAKERRSKGKDSPGGEDPDIAGIRPGPQPLPPEFGDVQNTPEK